MPDRDWVKYKAIRGKPLPQTGEWLGRTWRLVHVLKFDFYAGTGLYQTDDGAQVLYKSYHEDRVGIVPLGWLGRMLCRREVRFLKAVEGIEGLPQFLEGCDRAAFLREFVPGKNLREHGKLAGLRDDFFPRLTAILHAVHVRGISHNDLSKPENVLVDVAGAPVLIDFQIALSASRGLFSWIVRPFVRYMQGIDRYHLRKLHRRFRPLDFTPEELAKARKKSWTIHAHGLVRRPYRAVRHFILDRFMKAEANGSRS